MCTAYAGEWALKAGQFNRARAALEMALAQYEALASEDKVRTIRRQLLKVRRLGSQL